MLNGGSFGEKDGISVMIKAFEEIAYQFPQVHIYLSGKASKRHSEILTGIFKGTPLKDKITHLGYLDEKKYFSVIEDMDVLE